MNEKIRLFERQSGIDVYGLGKDRDKWEHKLEQFAELIVKECISELRDTFDMTIEEGNHLKEHFGVEE